VVVVLSPRLLQAIPTDCMIACYSQIHVMSLNKNEYLGTVPYEYTLRSRQQ
jgi:hypothetical protein